MTNQSSQPRHATEIESAQRWLPDWVLPRNRINLGTGVDLAYVDLQPAASAGSGSRENAPVMVLLHGYTNDADAWAGVVDSLRELLPEYRFVIPDLRGHGASSLPADGRWRSDPATAFTMNALATDVVALMDELDIDTAAVVGHSMGSLVAQTVAGDNSMRASKLVLVSTTGDARGTPFLADWLRHDVIANQWRMLAQAQGRAWPDEAMSLTPLDVDPHAVAWMQQFWNYYPLTPKRSTLEAAERAARLPFASWVGALEGILRTDRLAALRDCVTPTFVLWATQDSFFRRESQELLIAALTEAANGGPCRADTGGEGAGFVWKQYGRLPLPADGIQATDLGHNLTWDAPDVVAADVAAFVKTGMPTPTWFRSDAPADPYRIVGEAAQAPIITAG